MKTTITIIVISVIATLCLSVFCTSSYPITHSAETPKEKEENKEETIKRGDIQKKFYIETDDWDDIFTDNYVINNGCIEIANGCFYNFSNYSNYDTNHRFSLYHNSPRCQDITFCGAKFIILKNK